MSKDRKKIPSKLETEILFLNDRKCCICKDPNKRVQIHHIDGNPNNNTQNNLAVVCAEHQDEIHKSGGITKGISPTLVKKYKLEWESTVRSQRTQFDPQKSSLGIERILFEFEIRKAAYEIVALGDKSISEINQRLDFLDTLHTLEGYAEQILRALYHIDLLVWSDENKSCLIVNKIPEFFYHLIGMEEVKIKEQDNLELAIKTIGTIGSFSAEFSKSVRTLKSVFGALRNIWDILLLHNLESHALIVLDKLDEISRACKTVYEDEEPLTLGISELSKLCKKLKTTTVQEQPGWKKVLARLNKI
jgi:hypothetical protein